MPCLTNGKFNEFQLKQSIYSHDIRQRWKLGTNEGWRMESEMKVSKAFMYGINASEENS